MYQPDWKHPKQIAINHLVKNLSFHLLASYPMVILILYFFLSPLISLNHLDTYTVTQAVNALGFGWFQVKLSLCVGLCWMADSMEMTILSVLGPALHCDWGISRYQQALTTTVVFLGMMLSSTFWGQLSDRYGRKPVYTIFFQLNSFSSLTVVFFS